MKVWKLFIIMLLMAFILSTSNPGAMTVNSDSDNDAIVLKQLQGNVQYKSQGWWLFTGKWKTVEDRVELNQGDHIKTGDQGRAELFYLNEARILIEENTRVQIKENKRGELQVKKLKLDVGKIIVEFMQDLRDKMSFEVETPTAVAGVRGTMFSVTVNEQKETTVSVEAGKVSVSTDEETISVKKGETAVVKKQSQKPEIGQFKQDDVREWQQNRSVLKETEKKSEIVREEFKEKMKEDNSDSKDEEDKSENKPEELPPESQQSDNNDADGKGAQN